MLPHNFIFNRHANYRSRHLYMPNEGTDTCFSISSRFNCSFSCKSFKQKVRIWAFGFWGYARAQTVLVKNALAFSPAELRAGITHKNLPTPSDNPNILEKLLICVDNRMSVV